MKATLSLEAQQRIDKAHWKNCYPEVNDGAQVCKKLKIIYFASEPWADCYMDVADKFTALKAIMRKAYPDRPKANIVKELSTYSLEDIKDVFG